MVESIGSLVEAIFSNPLQGSIVVVLIIFVFLYVSKRKETELLKTKLNEEKQAFYIELVVFLNKVIRQKITLEKEDELNQLIELDAKLKLYAADSVVLAWADFWKACYGLSSENNPTSLDLLMRSIGLLQHAIRKDLRSSSIFSTLKWFDFSRSILNDLDTLLSERDKEYRTSEMRQTVKSMQNKK